MFNYTGFLPICHNQIQGLFKEFQGPYEGYIRRTKLNQTGTFTSICKHRKLPQQGRGFAPAENGFYAHLRSEKTIWNTFFSINWFGLGVLKNQIQGLSRTMSVFKDFPGLENLEKKFKDFQGLVRALITSPRQTKMIA